MAKKKNPVAEQWKVIRVEVEKLERTCEEWSARGWTIRFVLGNLANSSLAVVCSRFMTL